ncbi:VOC family protein [Rhodococcus sp. SGAir0479]|uniref:VOC family protein n=1 Tax=Rhodococcus sp. SGAir0479 TaxID=2567884 RepID=UPI0010CD1396|nr:VOC family protein [Rhodococcus sp. SGAir0479]QCQ89865.1 VOC family protein [Rhodococcus sp. SGAir0479]
MGYEVQVTVDSKDPHRQAQWWAQALGWRVEPSDEEFIRRMVAAGHAQESDTTVFEGTLVWREGAAISDPEHPQRPRMLFQRVPEGKSVKNRMHLDIRVGDRREEVAEELVAAGASVLHRGQVGPSVWITMADPEGNEFCVG